MNLDSNTIGRSVVAGLCGAWTYAIASGLDFEVEKLFNGSTINIIRTGTVLFALSILVGIVAKKIFEECGRPFEINPLTISEITAFTIFTVAPPVTYMLGFSRSLSTAFAANAQVGIYLMATYNSAYAIGNLFVGSPHRNPARVGSCGG